MKRMVITIICFMVFWVSGAVNAKDGKSVYEAKCQMCHATGVANAPKYGDKAAWLPRIAKGMDVLLKTVISGKGGMPPRGACADCSDDDLKAATDYMVSNSK